MRVVVLTTSYPRGEDDYAGRFVADLVERVRERGVDVTVVAPGDFDDRGLAYGDGLVANARRRPWAVPGLLGSMARATRRSARGADLVHAHWLPSGAIARLAGRPYVVSLHGSDVALAARVPALARPVLRAASGVICVSTALAAEAHRLGAVSPVVVPNGVEPPPTAGRPAPDGPVLYVGRLSPEKGIEELAAATEGLPRRIVGDGPLRRLVPDAVGFLGREELAAEYAAAALVVVPSRREGFGLACAEAMAHGRAVVATGVGGLADLVVDGETGVIVPPCDADALRAAIKGLLADPARCALLGTAAREHILRTCAWPDVVDRTLRVYEAALGRRGGAP